MWAKDQVFRSIEAGHDVYFNHSYYFVSAGVIARNISPIFEWGSVHDMHDACTEANSRAKVRRSDQSTFHCQDPTEPASDLSTSRYYHQKFCCVIRKGNTYGVQFHPEKSSAVGFKLLESYLSL